VCFNQRLRAVPVTPQRGGYRIAQRHPDRCGVREFFAQILQDNLETLRVFQNSKLALRRKLEQGIRAALRAPVLHCIRLRPAKLRGRRKHLMMR
jgi:hypothetical protein